MKNIYIIIFPLIICFFACNLMNDTQAPQVGAIQSNSGFTVDPSTEVKFWITATDPEGGQLSYKWSINGGTILSGTKSDTLRWRSPSVGGGSYPLSVEVSNESKETTQEEVVTVLAYTSAEVSILSPLENTYIVQHSQVEVEAKVLPNTQISEVQLFVNDSLIKAQLWQSNSIYSFNWNVKTEPGVAEIKVKAIRVTNVSNSDSIYINIEGILPGKSGD